MSSAVVDDLTARARVRDAAVARFGRDGFGASLRTIAARRRGERRAADPPLRVQGRPARGVRRARAAGDPGEQGRDRGRLTGRDARRAGRGRAVRAARGVRRPVARATAATSPPPSSTTWSTTPTPTWSRRWRPAPVRPSRDERARARYLTLANVGLLLLHLRLGGRSQGADLAAALRDLSDEVTLPALELYTEGLFVDRTLLDAYLPTSRPTGGRDRADRSSGCTERRHDRTDLAVDVRGLAAKSFGRFRALDGLDLTVPTGQVRRLPRPERRRQDHHDPGPARAAARRRRHACACSAATRGPTPSTLHSRLAYVPGDVNLWPNLTGGEAIDLLGRLRGGTDPAPPGRAARAVRARPDQEGAHVLQGQPAEGRARRGAGERRRAARARRADLRPGPVDGERVHARDRRGHRRRSVGAAVEPHPRRGREALRHA